MAVAVDQLWLLLVESGLFTSDQAREQAAAFAQLKGAADRGGSAALAQWLIARGLLTRYQAKKLVSGHATKFIHGDYVIQERIREGPQSGLLRAIHRPTRQEVLLYFRDLSTPAGSRRLADDLRRSVVAQGEARVIEAATLGCYHWHESGKSRFIALEATDGGETPRRIFAQWLSPGAASHAAPPLSAAPHQPDASASPAAAPSNAHLASPVGVTTTVPPSLQSQQPAPQPGPQVVVAAAEARRRRRAGPPPVWIAAAAGALVAAVGMGILFWTGGGGSTTGPDASTSAASPEALGPTKDVSTTSETKGSVEAATGHEAAAAKSARADTARPIDAPLWQSPTMGKPLELKYLPSGVQMVIALRPAEIVAHAEAARLLDARTLGPLADWFTKDLPALAGQPLSNIEQALIGLLDGGAGPPRVVIVAHLRTSVPEEELLKAWGSPPAGKDEGFKRFERDGRAWYLPKADGATVVVAGAAEDVKQIAESGETPPVLQRELEALLAASDERRHVTVLFAPRFLFTGGKALLSGPAARLNDPLDWFFSGHESGQHESAEKSPDGDAAAPATAAAPAATEIDASGLGLAKGAMVSVHLADDLFAELRVYANLERSPAVVAGEFQARVAAVPKRVDRYVRSLALSPYSYDVLWQFPRMVEQVERFTTAGYDGKQVVLRVYLPAVAAHNLALGTHLALMENPRELLGGGTTGQAGGPPAGAAAVAAATATERLKRKISLVFPSNTLEKALQSLGEEIGLPVAILGADLQLEGITRNQSFALDERDQPADEILRKIMLRANPDGKLVYVVKPKEGGTDETLYITTHAAAAQRGDTLPTELNK